MKRTYLYEQFETPAKLRDAIIRAGNPVGVANDEYRRYKNFIEEGEAALCSRCSGTGNELLSMYKKCVICNGSGLTKGAAK